MLIISALSGMTMASGVSAQAWLDLTIGPGGVAEGVYDIAWCVALDPREMHVNTDNSIIITGEVTALCNIPQTNSHFFAAKFHPDGTVDSTFGEFGIAYANPCTSTDYMQHSELLSDGSVMLAGYEYWPYINDPSNQAVVAKFLPNGVADTTYGMSGIRYISASPSDLIVRGMDVDSQDRVLLFLQGGGGGQGLCRLDQFGAYDTTFAAGILPLPTYGPDTTQAVTWGAFLLQNDDKILMTGRYGTHPLYTRFITRFLPDGSLDNTFATSGYFVNGPFNSASFGTLAVDDLGRITSFGGMDSLFDLDLYEATRWFSDGTLDISLGGDGFATFAELPAPLTSWISFGLLPDGRMVYRNSMACKLVAQDGSEIPTFGNNGVASVSIPNAKGRCFAAEADGNIIMAAQTEADRLKWVRYFTDISTSAQDLDAALEQGDWLVFPNPFSDGLVVRKREGGLEGTLRFELMQADGRLVYSETMTAIGSGSDMRLDVPAGLVAGSYLLSITNDNGTTVLPVLRSN